MAHPFTSHLFFSLVFFFSFTSSAFSNQLSPSVASTQIKFWSENVNNKMPKTISTKLSPLTKQDSDYYTRTVSQNNFKADKKFCSLAKLACSLSTDEFRPFRFKAQDGYGRWNNGTAIPLEIIDIYSYFRLSILKEGYAMHLSILKEPLPSRTFLPPQIATKIPLTLQGITKIFPETTKEGVRDLSFCSVAALKGESKACLKSLEEMINFAKTTLGTSKLLVLTTKSTTESVKELTIKKIKQFNAEKIVTCHELSLPFVTYYCHSLSSSRLYSVDFVETKTGTPVNTVMAVCHMDTSQWSANRTSLKRLKLRPGEGEACHWNNEVDLAWIASEKNM